MLKVFSISSACVLLHSNSSTCVPCTAEPLAEDPIPIPSLYNQALDSPEDPHPMRLLSKSLCVQYLCKNNPTRLVAVQADTMPCTDQGRMTSQTVQSLAHTWSKCPHRLPAKFHIPKHLHPLTPLQHTVKLFRNCLQNIEHCFYFSNHCLVCATTLFIF